MLVADVVGLPRALGERQVIFLRLGQHVFRCDEIGIVVLDMRHPGDVADRRIVVPPILLLFPQCRPSSRKSAQPVRQEGGDNPGNAGLICANGSSWS